MIAATISLSVAWLAATVWTSTDRAPDSGAGVTGGEGSEVITSRR
jgi:hypothetical protein